MSDDPTPLRAYVHPATRQALFSTAALMGWSQDDTLDLAVQFFAEVITGPKDKYLEMRDGNGKKIRTIHFCDEEPTRDA